MLPLASEEDCKSMFFLEDHCARDQNCTFMLLTQEYSIGFLSNSSYKTIALFNRLALMFKSHKQNKNLKENMKTMP